MLSSKASVSRASLRSSAVRPAAARSTRAVKVFAKYGQDSRYFDMNDMENTTGSWDLYGQDADKRYNGMQAEFFARSTDILTRREALRGFVTLFGAGALLTWGIKGSGDAKLPITLGPQTSGENGKGGSVRSRL